MKQAMQPEMSRVLDESELAGIIGGAMVCDGNACYLVAEDFTSPSGSNGTAPKRHGMSDPAPVPAPIPWTELKPAKRK
jgi:hypothetical protein